MSAKLMDVLQLISSNHCIMTNYTPLHWWAAEPWLVTYSNLSQLLFYAHPLTAIQRINQGSCDDILLCWENIHLLNSFCRHLLQGLSLGHSCDMHRVPDRHTDAHRTLAHTTDSFTVKDKWRLTLWPGEMAGLNSSEMKILLTKVPWAKQVVSLGHRHADFCSSRATRQSKRAPDNQTESRQSLSPRHKLADWQLNGRKYSGPCCEFSTNTNNSPVVNYNDSRMKLLPLHLTLY